MVQSVFSTLLEAQTRQSLKLPFLPSNAFTISETTFVNFRAKYWNSAGSQKRAAKLGKTCFVEHCDTGSFFSVDNESLFETRIENNSSSDLLFLFEL